jgi:hypothetical protein
MANEKRLIDANAALEKLCEYCICGCYEFCEERCVEYRNISKLPTVDAVEVVRCKDCRWRKGKLCYMISGCPEPVGTGDDFFCSYGERKDNG